MSVLQAHHQMLADTPAPDPYWSNVVALLHFNGADGSTQFTDQKGKTFTRSGNARISSSNGRFGSSGYLPGASTDFVSAPLSGDFTFNTGDFTIEFDVMMLSAGTTNFLVCIRDYASGGEYQGNIVALIDGKLSFSTALEWVGATTAFPLNVLTHVAVTRESGTLRIFQNGVLVYSGTVTRDFLGLRTCFIGVSDNPANRVPANCYIDELRITKGVARYTAAFTPPSVPHPDY